MKCRGGFIHALGAVLAMAALSIVFRAAYAAEPKASLRMIYQDVRLYCMEQKDADAMAQAIVDNGEGEHFLPRPKSCYLNRITYEVVGIVSFHTKDHIMVKVVEVTDAATPTQKYYLIIPTQFIPRGYRDS